jgi:hypothetical protein
LMTENFGILSPRRGGHAQHDGAQLN